MPLYNKALDFITESDLNTLVATQDGEAKSIEYKEKLPNFKAPPPGRSEVLKEFLADVSSFANAAGGDLVYGVKAVKGVPTEVTGTGVQLPDVDGTVLQLEELIRSHIRPRFPFDIRPVTLTDAFKGVVLIVRVRRGFFPPHQITFESDYRFYSRNSAGKYRLDVDELRTLFDLAGSAAERIRNFRAERLARIVSGQTPTPLDTGPKTIIHLVPLGAFDRTSRYDIIPLSEPQSLYELRPLAMSGSTSWRWNLDGLLTWSKDIRSTNADGYVQLFHNGIIEAVDANMIPKPWADTPGKGYIPADRWESTIIEGVLRLVRVQDRLGVGSTIVAMLSVIGVDNFVVDSNRMERKMSVPNNIVIDRNDLIIPEVFIEDQNADIGQVMKPVLDAVWQAAGWPGSLNYTDEGVRLR